MIISIACQQSSNGEVLTKATDMKEDKVLGEAEVKAFIDGLSRLLKLGFGLGISGTFFE